MGGDTPSILERDLREHSGTLAYLSGKGTTDEAIVPTVRPSAGALVRWACRSDNGTKVGRVTLQRMDNVGIVVESLDAAISFFAELGLELEGRATIEGDWAERVTGLRHMRVEIAMMRTPDGHSRLEISRFLTPPAVADHRNAPVNALGYLRIMFAVEDIDDTLARLRPHGAELVGELAQYEDKYRLCYVRGPEGILIGLAEQIG
jgi:catechol 2,3-dioxygenase-like lactoylglutathione lyase family enzyme